MMNRMESIFARLQTMLAEAWSQTLEKTLEIFPEAVLAVVIIGIGLLISVGVYFLAVRLMEFFAIDKLAGKTPLQQFLHNVGIHRSVSQIVALLLFWLGVLITLIFAADTLNLEQVSSALAVVTRFIPQVIAALLMIVFGMLLARFLQVFVEQTLLKVQERLAVIAGRVVYIVVLLFVLQLVVEHLGINLSFLTTNVMIAISAVIIVFAVSVVIAARPILENAIAVYQLRQELHSGQYVHIADISGTVQRFTVTSVVLRSGEETIVLPARRFFTDTYSLSTTHERGE